MESETPAQLPVFQETVVQAPPVVSSTGTIMYQISPDQVQPLLVQVPAGQFETTPEGQPIQFYYVTTSQPVQQEKPVNFVMIPHWTTKQMLQEFNSLLIEILFWS